MRTFLSANILSFADSVAMDPSAELRMPFLDRDLVASLEEKVRAAYRDAVHARVSLRAAPGTARGTRRMLFTVDEGPFTEIRRVTLKGTPALPRQQLVDEAVLAAGDHLGMLVDQHFSRGVDVTFFGRPCKANPAVARLARRFDCPIVAVRVVRLPGGKFEIKAEGPFELPRDADGQIDIAASCQLMHDVIERWVRENPGQYLWFHGRWR